MAGEYLVPNDFRAGSTNEVCQGITITPEEANDTRLTAAIARFSQRLDDLTDDHFSSRTAYAYEIDVAAYSSRLYLPERITAVTTVKTRDQSGSLTTQDAAAYRMHSSLDAAGARRLGSQDWLEITPLGSGLAGTPYTVWAWPVGPQTVEVTGTWGWTVTPGDAKRAVALMVWDHFKELNGGLRRVQRMTANGITEEFDTEGMTGILEADAIVRSLKRDAFVGVG